MFLNRLRQSYAFNILCVFGILELILFIVLLIIGLLTKSSLFGLILLFHIIGLLSILIFLLSTLIYFVELIFSIKISNQKYLCNKKITALQNVGITAFMLIVILDLLIFGSHILNLFCIIWKINYFLLFIFTSFVA